MSGKIATYLPVLLSACTWTVTYTLKVSITGCNLKASNTAPPANLSVKAPKYCARSPRLAYYLHCARRRTRNTRFDVLEYRHVPVGSTHIRAGRTDRLLEALEMDPYSHLRLASKFCYSVPFMLFTLLLDLEASLWYQGQDEGSMVQCRHIFSLKNNGFQMQAGVQIG